MQKKTQKTKTALTLAVGSACFFGGCVAELGGDEAIVAVDGEEKAAVILGSVDWQEASTLAQGTAQRANANAVAYLDIPGAGARCTGFLIAPDVIMTNQHCIPDASAARGVRAWFRYEMGTSGSETPVDCSGFLGNDQALDYALLQCAPVNGQRPGDVHGVVELEARNARRGEAVYAIHQNCDYYSDSSCAPTKKLSPGQVTDVSSEIAHSADTLGGSSGSPVFAGNTHKVIGLHHVGSGGDAMGRGSANWAVPMTRIVPALQQRYPGLQLGARAPSTPSTPTTPEPTTDLYEPNDTRAGATAVQLPFASQQARVESGDSDIFTFNSDGGARTIQLAFTHANGDLDLYVYDGNGREIGRSNGTTDVEKLQGTLARGVVYVRVIGYQGAVGSYTLSIQ